MNPNIFPRRSVWLAVFGLLALVFASLMMQGCGKGDDVAADGGKKGKGKGGRGGDGGPVPVEVAKVVRKSVPIDLTAVGNVEPLSTVSVRPQVSGQIAGSLH